MPKTELKIDLNIHRTERTPTFEEYLVFANKESVTNAHTFENVGKVIPKGITEKGIIETEHKDIRLGKIKIFQKESLVAPIVECFLEGDLTDKELKVLLKAVHGLVHYYNDYDDPSKVSSCTVFKVKEIGYWEL